MQTITMAPQSTGSGRWRAAAIHLGISVLIFGVLAALIAGLLFPGALFSSAGGWEGIRLIAGVDLVLGPLLTLIVFNRSKPRKEIVRDLGIIGCIQFAALAAGMYIVYQQRPITVTWANDRFYVATAGEYRAAKVAPSEQPKRHPLTPVFGYIELPAERGTRATLAATYALSGELMHMRMPLYRPMPNEAAVRQLLSYSALERDTSTRCVDVKVATRFGEFTHCFDPATRRFERAASTQ